MRKKHTKLGIYLTKLLVKLQINVYFTMINMCS